MSHALYNALWTDTQEFLAKTIVADRAVSRLKAEKNRLVAHAYVTELHTKYIQIIKRLEQCYDQIVQAQKRIVIRRLLDMCLGRCLELKHELVEIDVSEFTYPDNILIEMKLVPMEVEVTIPNYFIRAREEELEERKRTMAELVEKLGLEPPPVAAEEMSLKEIIKLIQRHERARQARYKAVATKRMKAIKGKVQEAKTAADKLEDEKRRVIEDEAALVIQKNWKGYRVRLRMKHRKEKELLMIGMVTPSWVSKEPFRRMEEVRRMRHAIQTENQLEFEDAQVREKSKIARIKGPWIIEDFCDHIRDWFIEWYRKTGRFPDFPEAEDGGSALMVAGLVMTPEEYNELEIEKAKWRAKSKAEKDKIKLERKKQKAKEKERKKREAALEKKRKKELEKQGYQGFEMKVSKFIPPLEEASSEYTTVWKEKNEKDNPLQKHYIDMIQVEKRAEVEVELRVIVDDMMRIELDMLNAALERDEMKRRKGKKKKKKNKKKKKKKKKKGKKGKKKKDPTADRTTEDLFEELFAQGIIRKYPEEKLSNFIGEYSYNNYEYRRMFKDPLPCLGDIRQVILEYCILPMGSQIVHQLAPLVRSLCLIGPRGCGKHMLVNAICSELGAVLFDLTPSNIAGKYPGKKGIQMLMHLVEKMSRLLQPSIIFVDGAEKPFYKKVPKPERDTEPKRLAKQLPKLVKAITPEDQVMMLGISKQPWAGRPKPFVKTYQKIILIPRADYGTLEHVWRMLLMKYHNVDREFDISSLAKVSTGYPLGVLMEIVEKVLTSRRILRLKFEPLTPMEIVQELCQLDPVTPQEMDKFVQWYSKKSVIGKKMAKIVAEENERREQEERENAKKKKK